MYKILIYFISIASLMLTLQGKEFKDEKLQIIANSLTTSNNILTAYGNILIHSQSYYITAQKVIYNKNNSTMELFENVNIIKDGTSIIFTDYAILDLNSKIDKFRPLLLLDTENSIWINSIDAIKQNTLINLKSSTLSSCDCYNPFWSISFTNGDYNSTKQWLNTYNTTLFIKEMPIFYTPYLGFPTDTTRRSGILRPTIGYSKREGLLYAQPIYYAPKANMDLEVIPQTRTLRGNGYQVKYRYKDSPYSRLDISHGKFTEQDKYMQEMNLKNKTHHGSDLLYDRTKLFSRDDAQDGLLVSLHYLNDIDYINTIYNKEKDIVVSDLITSNLKYFYNTDSLYSDIDFRYYQYASKENNDNTLQELPKINLHKYSKETFVNNLMYSADIKYSQKTRKEGLNANTTNIVFPLSYSTNFLNDFLNFAYIEQVSLMDVDYDNSSTKFTNGQFIENQHIISLSTDLLKPYREVIHTINLKADYTIPNSWKEDGDLYSVTSTNSTISIAPVTKTEKNIHLFLNQSFYDTKTKKTILNHKINQSIIFNNDDTSKLSDLDNEMVLYYKYGSLGNRSLYNHKDKLIIGSSTSLKFSKDNFASDIYYSYSKDTSGVSVNTTSYSYRDLPDAKSISGTLSYKFLKYYKVSYKEEYNLITHVSNKKEYTYSVDKKCWGLSLKLSDSIVASATTTNKATRQNIIYFQLALKPLAVIDQKYTQDIRKEK